VWQWIEPFRARVTDDFSPQTVEEFVAASLARTRHAQTWGVWRGEELGGVICLEHLNPVHCQSQILCKREFWGETPSAIRQVYELAFARGVQKISSVVFPDNHAIRSLARQIGAKQEGVLVHHTRRGGAPTNMLMLGLVKEDFHATA
jgi:RimJ/RimL family protein N-acetyltransferase